MAASLPPRRRPMKETTLPSGSGFARLIRKRADTNNLPGPQNAFGDKRTGNEKPLAGDKILSGFRKNTSPLVNNSGGAGRAGMRLANPRAGQMYQTGTTSTGQTVHLYKSGERIVLPKKKKAATFKYY
jgi:hypothetical protein